MMKSRLLRYLAQAACLLLALPAVAERPAVPLLPAAVAASAELLYGERDGFWEKTLLVSFPTPRRTLSKRWWSLTCTR